MSYESDLLRDWYLLFHYGTEEDILSGSAFSPETLPPGCLRFPSATVDFFQTTDPVGRALDIGCAVGRSGFELSRIAGEVIGIDFSHSFIEVANRMRAEGTGECRIFREAHLPETRTLRLPEGCVPERTSFEQGDAMDLREDLGSFDLVHAANLLCRLPEPLRFLNRLPALVNPGGKLVLATPATWMPEYTPVENIPAGPTLSFLQEHLGDAFDLVKTEEVPFLIREHQRKFQLSTSQTSLWMRK